MSIITLLMAGCTLLVSAAAPPEYRITLRKPDDRLTVSVEQQRTVLTITSPSGIGGATVERTGPQWPQPLIVRLRLSGLESCTVSNGRITLQAAVTSHGDHARRLHVIEAGKEKPIGQGSPYWTEIKLVGAGGKPAGKIPLKDGYFEMELPKALLQEQPKSLNFGWIDFYR